MFFYAKFFCAFIIGYFALYALSLAIPFLNHPVPLYSFLNCIGIVTLYNWILARKMVAVLKLQYETTDEIVDEVTSIQEVVRRHNENYICIDIRRLKNYLDSHDVEVNLDDFMGAGIQV